MQITVTASTGQQPTVHPEESQAKLWSVPSWKYGYPASALSKFGDVIFELTLIVWIATDIGRGQVWAPLAVTGVMLSAAIPTLAVGPVAGVITERYDKRKLIIASCLVQGVSIGAVVPLVAGGWEQVPLAVTFFAIFAALVLSNIAGQVFMQARTMMLASTIPDHLRTTAMSRQQATFHLLDIVGPPIAAPLLFGLGAGVAVGINATTFFIAAALLSMVKFDSAPDPQARATGFWAATLKGARVVIGHPLLRALVLCMSICSAASAILTAMMVFFIQLALGQDAEFSGVFNMIYAAGALVGATVAPWFDKRFATTRVLVAAIALGGVFFAALGLSQNIYLAIPFFLLGALPLGVFNVVLIPLLMRTVEREVLGHAVAALNFVPAAVSIAFTAGVGAFASSPLMGSIGFSAGSLSITPYATLIFAAGLILVVAAIVSGPRILRAKAIETATPAEG